MALIVILATLASVALLDPDAVSGAAAPTAALSPPQAVGDTHIPYPANAPILDVPQQITVKILVGEDGQVWEVGLLAKVHPVLDQAVLLGATHFRFLPARHHDVPVAVEITYTQTFAPSSAPSPLPSDSPILSARLEGELVERGTRKRLSKAHVVAVPDWDAANAPGVGQEAEYRTQSDEHGRFGLPLPAGAWKIRAVSVGHKPFEVSESLDADQRLRVQYLLERTDYNPYETVVIGQRERLEVARTTLRGREIRQVPGTFGDPFRVIDTMPGVGQIMSLFSYPIVRGTSPGNTGFFIDRVHIPQLFHFLNGPAVVHPEFIDRVDFYPGVFPTIFGGFTGGIVNGVTRRPEPAETRIETDIDLIKSGLFLRGPVPFTDNVTATVAGRYGYPGLLLSAFQSELYASYWDYQARFDIGAKDNSLTAFVFGAFDELGSRIDGERETFLRSQFHRLHLSYAPTFHHNGLYELILGRDQFMLEDTSLSHWVVTPRAMAIHNFSDIIQVRGGVEGTGKYFDPSTLNEAGLTLGIDSDLYHAGAFLDFPIGPQADWVVIPGMRADMYRQGDTVQWGIDPRLLARYRAFSLEHGDVWFKAGTGLYQQPPRFFVPIPGLQEMALEVGLVRSYQTSLGVEAPLSASVSIDTQVYFQYMSPLILDLQFSRFDGSDEPEPSEPEPFPVEPVTPQAPSPRDLFPRDTGRAYGWELMIRHQGAGRLFGWLSYTLSRSERLQDGGAWIPFDFDRTHMLHLVAGIRLPRNWEISGRMMYQTGRPVLAQDGSGDRRRLSPFFRFDFRIDKRAVWAGWLLDFYIDIINATISPEPLGEGAENSLPYLLPTVGMRAVF